LHDCVIPLSREVLVNKTSLTPTLFIEMSVPSHESEQSCICVLGVSIMSLSGIFLLGFGTVPTVWCFFGHFMVWFNVDLLCFTTYHI
jgi:hypothetical protein